MRIAILAAWALLTFCLNAQAESNYPAQKLSTILIMQTLPPISHLYQYQQPYSGRWRRQY